MKLFGRFLDLLYPKKCVFCGKILKDGECCFCAKCGEHLPVAEDESSLRDVPGVKKCIAPLYYEGIVRDSLHRYKFSGASHYAPVYGELIAPYILRYAPAHIDAVTWTPISRKRKRERGYDQAQLLAEHIAKEMGAPCVRLLDKTVNIPPQSGLKTAEQRRANVLGVYAEHGNVNLGGKTILLVDDIVTTGSTMGECARVLIQCGAKEIWGAAVAGGQKKAKKGEKDTCQMEIHTL